MINFNYLPWRRKRGARCTETESSHATSVRPSPGCRRPNLPGAESPTSGESFGKGFAQVHYSLGSSLQGGRRRAWVWGSVPPLAPRILRLDGHGRLSAAVEPVAADRLRVRAHAHPVARRRLLEGGAAAEAGRRVRGEGKASQRKGQALALFSKNGFCSGSVIFFLPVLIYARHRKSDNVSDSNQVNTFDWGVYKFLSCHSLLE